MNREILKIADMFSLEGTVTDCRQYGNGHINDTFLVETDKKRYILQRLNTGIFSAPQQVMENIIKVTAHIRKSNTDPRSVMSLVPLKNGKMYDLDDGGCWRMYDFVEDSLCLEAPESHADFYQCGLAFGGFQHSLSDFPAEELFETIKDFHNTPKRYEALLKAEAQDPCGRVAEVGEELEFFKLRREFYATLENAHRAGKLPLRVTHNDTKINNALLDAQSRKALCVIDLDTVMAGFSVTDFGDAIRIGANTCAEDEPDATKASLDYGLYEVFLKGFAQGCNGGLERDEIILLPEGALMMTLECGMRFLTDYISGDTYFKIKYPEHNLVRCRTQIGLAKSMEKQWGAMKAAALDLAIGGKSK